MSKYPVDKSEEAWKQELSAEEYRIFVKQEQNIPSPVNTTLILKQEPTIAKGVAPHSMLQVQNLTVVAAGPLMTKALKALLSTAQIIPRYAPRRDTVRQLRWASRPCIQ